VPRLQVYFNQLIFLAENATASTTTYAKGRWYGPLAGMPPTNDTAFIRICDFYRLKGDKIAYNWMMLDLPDLLRQAGRRVLPVAPVRDDGWFAPPVGIDGIPAPYSPLTPPASAELSRDVVRVLLDEDWFEKPGGAAAAGPLWDEHMRFYGPSGVGFSSGRGEYREHFIGVLRRGFSGRTFELDVLSCEGAYCAAHGHLHATHSGCFLGEAATGSRVRLRVGLHWHVVGGIATEGYAMFDTPALFAQLGIDLLVRTVVPPPCGPIDEPPLAATGEGTEGAAGSPPTPSDQSLPWSNDCLLGGDEALQPPTKDAPATFLEHCAEWVVRTTDAVWRPGLGAARVNASLEEYFYEGWSSVSAFGKEYRGMEALKELVWRTRRAFPDLRIHVTDVFCVGNDVDGYKTTMPDVLTGTHTGPSSFGPPTGKSFAYNGIAVCYVQKVGGRWQYVSEVVAHDELALFSQLGLTNLSAVPHPATTAAPHDCRTNRPTWGWQPPGKDGVTPAALREASFSARASPAVTAGSIRPIAALGGIVAGGTLASLLVLSLRRQTAYLLSLRSMNGLL